MVFLLQLAAALATAIVKAAKNVAVRVRLGRVFAETLALALALVLHPLLLVGLFLLLQQWCIVATAENARAFIRPVPILTNFAILIPIVLASL